MLMSIPAAELRGIRNNRNPKEFASVRDYLSSQGRFRHLRDENIEQIVRERERKWEIIRKNWRTK